MDCSVGFEDPAVQLQCVLADYRDTPNLLSSFRGPSYRISARNSASEYLISKQI